MGFQLKFLGFGVFLLLTLSLCQAKNVTVKVVGLIHCTDCIRHEFSRSQASLGVDVFISCKSKNGETKTQGNGAVNKEGKFNVTLSAEIKKDGNSIEGCLAKLQSASAAPCPIQSAQTASLKLLSTDKNATQTAHNSPTIIKFSPVTCQSAFLLPPNFTFFPTLPPPPVQPVEYAPPPSEALPPLAPPIQPPLPPAETSTPPPSPLAPPTQPPLPPVEYSIPPPSPLAPPIQPPLPPAKDSIPPPAPASEPPSLPPVPSVPPTLSPPDPEYGTPSPLPDLNFRSPSPSPTPTPNPTFQSPQNPPNPTFKSPSPPPLPIYNSPPPLPKHEKPNAIPRAPPVPRLPATPKVQRKYFNSPKSKSKPPHSP